MFASKSSRLASRKSTRLLSERTAWLAIYTCFAFTLPCPALLAQSSQPPAHYFLDSDLPPGAVGSARLLRGGPATGYFQPVSVSGPGRTEVSIARDGQFLAPLPSPVKIGMLVGAVYRVRVTNIPNRPGEELFPTIEVVDRLCAPPGREHRFPIPIVLDQDDLIQALDGALVTRVIYLEDSQNAAAIAQIPGEQRVVDVEPTTNALQVADQLGRPMAIVRIGSRVPSSQSDLTSFLYGCPPWIPLPPVPTRAGLVGAGMWPDTPMSEPGPMRSERPEADEPRIPRS